MSVLNPRDLISQGYITNYDPKLVQGNSIDLRIDRAYKVDGGVTLWRDGHRELPPYVPHETFESPLGQSFFEFSPESLYQVEFMERVEIPEDACSLVVLRSSMFKSGASSEVGLFDSGYKGGCGTVISVKFNSYIEYGAAIAQMIFFSASSAHLYKGFYQNRDDWRVVKEEK